MSNAERLWDIGLALFVLIITSFVTTNLTNAPLWLAVGVAFLVVVILYWQRHRLGRWIAAFGVRVGGRQVVERYFPVPPSVAPVSASPVLDPAVALAQARQREALGAVRDLVSGSMVHAHEDREHGNKDERTEAVAAASRAFARVHELNDEGVRLLVTDFYRKFDAIPKGWKRHGMYDNMSDPVGYPEPAWSELKAAADEAVTQLGALMRAMDSAP